MSRPQAEGDAFTDHSMYANARTTSKEDDEEIVSKQANKFRIITQSNRMRTDPKVRSRGNGVATKIKTKENRIKQSYETKRKEHSQ